MTVELTLDEAQIVIAVLTYAEGEALIGAPAITEALRALRPWRRSLLISYLREAEARSHERAGL